MAEHSAETVIAAVQPSVSLMTTTRWFILLLLAFSLEACTFAGTAKPFVSLDELHAAMKTTGQTADADSFWARVLAHKAMPLIFDQNAVFLWRGEANRVEWRGDFSMWEPSPETDGRRLGKTDIWSYERSFPNDARLDYKLVLDGDNWQLDPLNPHQQLGGYGPNSEVRMPDWKPPANTVLRKGLVRGSFSKDIEFKSTKLGYALNYRVYKPAGFNAASSRDLPVLYVTDGSDYWNDDMGSLVITLDNLIADKRIVPILVVFIDPWDRKANVNRREKELIPDSNRVCAFCEFIVDELIPAIDAAYPTRRTRDGRAIVGTSFGGLHSALMSMRHASLFGMAGIQSPALNPVPWLADAIDQAELLPAKIFINAGTFEDQINDARRLRDIFVKHKVDVKFIEVHEGHSWGQWRALLDDMLLFFFGKQ